MTADTKCPKCGSKAIPVVYGYPTPEVEARRDRGEIALGGCMVGLGTEPDFRCTSCGCGWRHPRLTRGAAAKSAAKAQSAIAGRIEALAAEEARRDARARGRSRGRTHARHPSLRSEDEVAEVQGLLQEVGRIREGEAQREGHDAGHAQGRAEGPRHAAGSHSEQAKERDEELLPEVVRLANEGLTIKEIAQTVRPIISARKVVDLKRLARQRGQNVRGHKRRR